MDEWSELTAQLRAMTERLRAMKSPLVDLARVCEESSRFCAGLPDPQPAPKKGAVNA